MKRSDAACGCGCGFDTVDYKLNEIHEYLCIKYGAKNVNIHCVCRCDKHNKKVGGSKGSMHKYARAMDFDVKGVDHDSIYEDLEFFYGSKCGPHLDKWGIHIDTRGYRARW